MAKGWLIGGAVALGALLVASIVVALMEETELLPEGTASAAVQRFLMAVEDEEFELAHGFLTEDLKAECPVDEFFGGTIRGMRDSRITLEGTRAAGETVFVTVRITEFRRGGGPLGSSESSYEQRYSLRQEGERWQFTEYPWPFFRCGPFKQQPAVPGTSEIRREVVAPEHTATPPPERAATPQSES